MANYITTRTSPVSKNDKGEVVNKNGLTLEEYVALEQYKKDKESGKITQSYNASQINQGLSRDEFDAKVRGGGSAASSEKGKNSSADASVLPTPPELENTGVKFTIDDEGNVVQNSDPFSKNRNPSNVTDNKKTSSAVEDNYVEIDSGYKHFNGDPIIDTMYVPTVNDVSNYYSPGEDLFSSDDVNAAESAYKDAERLFSATSKMLQSGQKTLYEMETELNRLGSEAKRLFGEYEASPSAEKAKDYNEAYDTYTRKYDEYTAFGKTYNGYYEDYKGAHQILQAKGNEYSALATKKSEAYKAWRSTVRSSELVKIEIDAVNKAIAQLEGTLGLSYGDNAEANANKTKQAKAYNALIDYREKITEEFAYSEEVEKAEYYASYAEKTSLDIYKKYGQYFNLPDFDKYSKKGAAIKNPTWIDVQLLRANADDIGNIVTYSRDNHGSIGLKEAMGYQNEDYGRSIYQYMTDFEVNVYNYFLAKEGKASAQKFLDDIEETLNARLGGQIADSIQNTGADTVSFLERIGANRLFSEEDIQNIGKMASITAHGTHSILGGMESFATGTKQLFSEEALPTTAMAYANQELLNDLDGFAKIAYQAGNTVGNMLPSVGAGIAFGPVVGQILQSSSAAGNAYGEALKEGKTKEEAAAYGVMIGGLEFVTSKLLSGVAGTTGNLPQKAMNKIDTFKNSLLRAGAKYGINIGSEITEEELQLWLEPFARQIAFGEDYDAPTFDEMAATAIVTALSTGILNSSTDIATKTISKIDYQNTLGKSIINKNGGTDALIKDAIKLPKYTTAYKLAQEIQEKIKNGKKPTAAEIGKLSMLLDNAKDSVSQNAGEGNTAESEAQKNNAPTEIEAEENDGIVNPDDIFAEFYEDGGKSTEQKLTETSSIKLTQPFEEYSAEKQKTITEFVNSVDDRIVDFVEKNRNSKKFSRLNLDQLSSKAVTDISDLVGFSVDGYVTAINTNATNHIEKRHGKNGAQDHTMENTEDIARLTYVIDKYDTVEILTDSNGDLVLSEEFRNADDTKAQMIKFSKKIDGTYYVVEAVPDSSYKKMWIVSAYTEKGVTQESNAANATLNTTSKTHLASPPSDIIISQKSGDSNTSAKKSNETATKDTGKAEENDGIVNPDDIFAELYEDGGENATDGKSDVAEDNDGIVNSDDIFAEKDNTKYSIEISEDGKRYVSIETDILDGVPEADWVSTVKNNLKQKFPNGITLGNNTVNIDDQSRKEMTYSRYMQWLYNNDQTKYADKLRATDNSDEILEAADGWVSEGLKHSRKDKIIDFARGSVLLKIGQNDYTAEVIVGTEKDGTMKLYDIINLNPTSIKAKEMDTALSANPSPGAARKTADISYDNSISQKGDDDNSFDKKSNKNETKKGENSDESQSEEWNTKRSTEGDHVSDGSRERNAGERSRKQAGELGQSTERWADILEGSDRAEEIERARNAASLRTKLISSASLGIEKGTDNPTLRIYPEEMWDDNLKKTADHVFEETGKKAIFVQGPIEIKTIFGKRYARGVNTDDNIIIRMNDPKTTPERIALHEIYHDKATQFPLLNEAIKEAVIDKYSPEAFEKVFEAYADKLAGVYELEDASEESYKALEDAMLEEIFADAYANINSFGAFPTQFRETVLKIVNEESQRLEAEKKKAAEATKESYSLDDDIQYPSTDIDKDGDLGYNGNDLYTTTDEFYLDVAKGDRDTFTRSLANKTTGMAKDEIRTVEIYGADTIYYFKATGYMQGRMLYSANIDDVYEYRAEKKENLNGNNSSRQTFSSWASILSLDGTGTRGDIHSIENGRTESDVYEVYGESRTRNGTRTQERIGENFRDDPEEVERIISELRKKYNHKFSIDDTVGAEEEYFTYKNLISKPDMHIAVLTLPNSYSNIDVPPRSVVVEAALSNARLKNNPKNTKEHIFVRNNDTGNNILVNRNSIKHGLYRNYGKNAIAYANIGEIIENAILINKHTARKDGVEGNIYLSAGWYGNELYLCRIITNEENSMENLEVMYALNTKKELVAHNRLGIAKKLLSNTNSSISISDFLTIVKDHFADVLPENVLKQMSLTRPKSTVSDSVKFSIDDTAGAEEGSTDWIRRELKRARLEKSSENVGKEGGKQEKQKKLTPKEMNAPTKSRRALKNVLYKLFSVPSGKRGELGALIDSYTEKIIKNGKLTDADKESLIDRLYAEGVVTSAADSNLAEKHKIFDGRAIYVSDDIKAAFGDSWSEFRRRAFDAGINFSPNMDDTDISEWNAELSEAFPEIFSQGENDAAAILENVVTIAEEAKGQGMSLAEFVMQTENEGGKTQKEVLDDLEEKVDTALYLFAQKAKLEISFRERTGEKLKQQKEAFNAQRAEERRKQMLKDAKKRQERLEAAARKKENENVRAVQNETIKTLQWLSRHQNKTSPEFKAKFEEVLSDIDIFAKSAANEMRWSNRHQATWQDIDQMCKDAKDNDPNFIPSDEMERIIARLNKRKISDMDMPALMDYYKATIALKTEYQNRRYLLLDEKHRSFSEIYRGISKDMATDNEIYTTGKVKNFFNEEQLTPMNVLQRMCDWNREGMLYSLGELLEKGERDVHSYIVKAGDIFNDFLEKNRKWVTRADGQHKHSIWYTEKVYPYIGHKFNPESGRREAQYAKEPVTIHMTPAMKVYLYLESLGIDNLRHMTAEGGGRTFPDRELYSMGKRGEAFAQGTTVRLSPETIKQIADPNKFSSQEKELFNLINHYFNDFAKGEINKTSNALHGYDKAMSGHYAQIFTNKNYTKAGLDHFGAPSAEGVGNLKERMRDAMNPTYNVSVFDAFQKHVSTTSKYVGLSIPIHNFKLALNWRENENSARDRITHKWGRAGLDYIEKMLTDIQSDDKKDKTATDRFLSKLSGNYVSAVFGLNPSIVFKQLGSISTAATYLEWRNRIVRQKGRANYKAMGVNKRELISKYTRELDYRTLGFSSEETKILKDNPGLLDSNKATQFMLRGGAITWMDGWAAETLWSWTENKMIREHPELELGTNEEILKGESEFYKAVAKEFDYVVSRTQSMSDFMHQSTLRKSDSPLARIFTLFRSDAAQNYNVHRQLVGEALYLQNSGADPKEISKAWLKVSRAVLNAALGYSWVFLIDFLMNLWKYKGKRYKDDEGEITARSIALGWLESVITDYSGIVAGGELLAETLASVLSGKFRYDTEAIEMEQFNELLSELEEKSKLFIEICAEAGKIIDGGGDLGQYFSKKSGAIAGGIKDIAKTIATYAAGLPADNLEVYLLGAIKWISPELGARYDDLFDTVQKKDLKELDGKALRGRIERIMDLREVDISDKTAKAIAVLYSEGYTDAIPSATPSSVTINKEEKVLDVYMQQVFDNVWGDIVSGTIDDIVSSDIFKNAEPEAQFKMLNKLYDYAANKAKVELFEDYEDGRKATDKVDTMLQVLEDVGLDMTDYFTVSVSGIFDNESKTSAFLSLAEEGFSAEKARNLLDEYSDTAKNASDAYRREMGLPDGSVYKEFEIKAIRSLDVPDNVKKLLYSELLADEKFEGELSEFEAAGMDIGDYLACEAECSRINRNEDLTSNDKAITLSRWVNAQGYKGEKAELIKDTFKFFTPSPASADNYDNLIDLGYDDKTAMKILESGISTSEAPILVSLEKNGFTTDRAVNLIKGFDNLPAKNGRESAGSYQKAEYIADSVKVSASKEPAVHLEMFEHVLSDSAYERVKLAYNGFGVWPEMYVKVYNRAEDIAFKDGKTNINQSHATEALKNMDLTNGQKAIIWAFITKGKENPFSKEQGARVLAALDKLSK